MSQKLRYGTQERITHRDRHIICRRTYLSYDRLMQLDAELARSDFLRQQELETRIRKLRREKIGG